MQITKVIAAPAARVWEILTDTRLWPLWGPSVSAVDSPRRYLAAGLQGRVQTAVGLWLPFEITRFEAPSYWHWRVAGLPATGHRVTSLDEGECALSFEFPLWAAPYGLVCRLAAEKIARLAREQVGSPSTVPASLGETDQNKLSGEP